MAENTEAPAVDQVAEAVKSEVNGGPAAQPQAVPMQRIHKACPCGAVPTDLIISIPQGSKYGTVAGNCCAIWAMEFKAGYPRDEKHAAQIGIDAWRDAPRA